MILWENPRSDDCEYAKDTFLINLSLILSVVVLRRFTVSSLAGSFRHLG